MHILVVEDDKLLRHAISHRLVDAGHTVSAAADGAQALSVIEKNSAVDVIICDILMPQVSGPTLILKLKKHFPERLPVIIIITAVKEGDDFLKKLDIEYDHFLPKPVDFDKLDEMLASLSVGGQGRPSTISP